jgi:hypothetical protein
LGTRICGGGSPACRGAPRFVNVVNNPDTHNPHKVVGATLFAIRFMSISDYGQKNGWQKNVFAHDFFA